MQVTATELIAGVSGESENRIRDLFDKALTLSPCVLFIDEVDSISGNRLNAQKNMEHRIVTQLLSCMDSLSKDERGLQVLVIGATNRVESIDPALRRVGRFDQEICIGIPDKDAREQILQVICGNLKLERPFEYKKLAMLTPGYVGADLLALATRAASTAVKRAFSVKGEAALNRKFVNDNHKNNSSLDAVVNLTDDSLFMDVEELPDIMKETVDFEKIPTTTNEASNENEAASVTPAASTVVATTTDEEGKGKENGEKVIVDDNATAVDKEKEIESSTTSNGDAIVETTKVDEPDTTLTSTSSDIDVVSLNTATENAEESKSVSEGTKEVVTDEASVEDADVQCMEAEPIIQEIDDDDEDVLNDDDEEELKIDEVVEDSLRDAVLRRPGVKLQLTLNEMMSWLSDTSPPIAGNELKNLCITMDDFVTALKSVQPSAKREGFITIPDTTWDDIGSLTDIREELKLAILAPVKFPEKLKRLKLHAPAGVLLCGPPGCGKTLLAKAVANEAGINFISVKGPELLNMYVGESERAVRQCFQRARNSAPCVIFFDEFDSLCPKRSDNGEGGAGARVVNQLLTEMDGVEDRKGVFLMAASNRPDMVDPAVLRPGRLDKILYVGLPKETDRADILRAITKVNHLRFVFSIYLFC